ncbi:phage virion morphogenesis protein [Citrobacter freundii]|uniref:phage virion morphogenesis protein n=1 Tax=Citrobacter freundii TaxID=546 RepID=UPI0028BF0F4C|nr:phage virion morphogenesis protein [Citrobacter freundii]MDT7309087.1 phage virion morphogenesis protein [Citrobacter freundii]
MNEFKPFNDKLAGLIGALSPAAQRWLASDIAKELRRSQQQRIKQQKAPDGIPYQERKRQPLRAKKGRIKRAMFQKLRTSRYLKASGRNDAAVVEFTGKVQRIARVHQHGLRDQPNPHAHEIQYPERQLLGFSQQDKKLVDSLTIAHFKN